MAVINSKVIASGLPGLHALGPGDGDLRHYRRCDLRKHASQAVSGEGAAHTRIMLVGEQPGEEEDLRGHPFVGPAGRVLDQCLDGAALERNEVFVTNAVKQAVHLRTKLIEDLGRARALGASDAR
jgi:uracil-DNA glycosylase